MDYVRPVHLDPNAPDVRRVARALGFAGKRITVQPAERVALSGTYWDGGCRNAYAAVSLETLERVDLPRYDPPQFGGPSTDPVVDIPEGVAVACIAQGAYKSMHLYVRPENLTRMLPAADAAPMDDVETLALLCTAALKNSYGGRSDIRYTEAQRHRATTRDEWNAALESLKARGYLNRANAITVDGRNAIANHPRRYSV